MNPMLRIGTEKVPYKPWSIALLIIGVLAFQVFLIALLMGVVALGALLAAREAGYFSIPAPSFLSLFVGMVVAICVILAVAGGIVVAQDKWWKRRKR